MVRNARKEKRNFIVVEIFGYWCFHQEQHKIMTLNKRVMLQIRMWDNILLGISLELLVPLVPKINRDTSRWGFVGCWSKMDAFCSVGTKDQHSHFSFLECWSRRLTQSLLGNTVLVSGANTLYPWGGEV